MFLLTNLAARTLWTSINITINIYLRRFSLFNFRIVRQAKFMHIFFTFITTDHLLRVTIPSTQVTQLLHKHFSILSLHINWKVVILSQQGSIFTINLILKPLFHLSNYSPIKILNLFSFNV